MSLKAQTPNIVLTTGKSSTIVQKLIIITTISGSSPIQVFSVRDDANVRGS